MSCEMDFRVYRNSNDAFFDDCHLMVCKHSSALRLPTHSVCQNRLLGHLLYLVNSVITHAHANEHTHTHTHPHAFRLFIGD